VKEPSIESKIPISSFGSAIAFSSSCLGSLKIWGLCAKIEWANVYSMLCKNPIEKDNMNCLVVLNIFESSML